MKKHLAEGNPKKIKLISGDTEASERAKEAKERADKLKQEVYRMMCMCKRMLKIRRLRQQMRS
jgi:hypothetical protein